MQPFWRGAWYLLRQIFHFSINRCLAMAGPYGVLDSALPAQPVLQPYKQVRLFRAWIPGSSSLEAVGAVIALVQGQVRHGACSSGKCYPVSVALTLGHHSRRGLAVQVDCPAGPGSEESIPCEGE